MPKNRRREAPALGYGQDWHLPRVPWGSAVTPHCVSLEGGGSEHAKEENRDGVEDGRGRCHQGTATDGCRQPQGWHGKAASAQHGVQESGGEALSPLHPSGKFSLLQP